MQLKKNLKYKIKDKVFVNNWDKHYSNIYKWKNNIKITIFNWKTVIPDYCNIDFFWKYIYEPNLTVKGTVNKKEPKKLVSKIPEYKNFEYTIEEIIIHNNNLIYLLSSKEGCWVQIGEDGISILTLEEQKKVKHLETEKALQVLAIQNLGKWTIDTADKKTFPKELLKYVYDVNQNTLFGSSITKAIIKYPYISKEYTVNNNDICLGWEQDYNGVGCDLTDKETISWDQIKQKFPENTFI